MRSPEIKEKLKVITDATIARGVIGVPTIEAAGSLFWGDDKLDDAAWALRNSGS